MYRLKTNKSVALCLLMLLGAWNALTSCSGDDYLNAIPSKSTALVSVDLQALSAQKDMEDKAGALKQMLHVDDVSGCGIDVSEKLYFFETADGNLGLCAKVDDEDNVASWLDKLAKEHCCSAVSERKGYRFAVLDESWMVGFSSAAVLVMGPVVPEGQTELQRQMARMLGAEEKAGIKNSRLFTRLDSIAAPVAMVAQVRALPEKFAAPLTIGAPKDADASEILVAAGMNVENKVMRVKARTFSFNKAIDQALQKTWLNCRPIHGDYIGNMPSASAAGIFMNVNGKDFLPVMQRNAGLHTLLLGINTAIDMDNIIRSVDGDLALVVPSFSEDNLQLKMTAKLAHANWLSDVDYWKKSCPAGASIVNWGKNAFRYSDGKTSFFFGVTPDLQFYCGNDAQSANAALTQSDSPLPSDVRQMLKGQKMGMVLNLGLAGGGKDVMGAVSALLRPLFGNVACIVCTMQ